MATCNCVSSGSQIFSQFRFHLDRSVKGHWVQMFVKLWHQSHAIFPLPGEIAPNPTFNVTFAPGAFQVILSPRSITRI